MLIDAGISTSSTWGWIATVVTIVVVFSGIIVVVTLGRKMNNSSKEHWHNLTRK